MHVEIPSAKSGHTKCKGLVDAHSSLYISD